MAADIANIKKDIQNRLARGDIVAIDSLHMQVNNNILNSHMRQFANETTQMQNMATASSMGLISTATLLNNLKEISAKLAPPSAAFTHLVKIDDKTYALFNDKQAQNIPWYETKRSARMDEESDAFRRMYQGEFSRTIHGEQNMMPRSIGEAMTQPYESTTSALTTPINHGGIRAGPKPTGITRAARNVEI